MKTNLTGPSVGNTRVVYIHGERIPARFRMVLAMTWIGWVNYCVLQWFGVRFEGRVFADGKLRLVGAHFAWPMTEWYLSLRREVVIPTLLSLPVVALVLALWRFAC